jgi:branched-chain amino acid transport system substrate-binding protein
MIAPSRTWRAVAVVATAALTLSACGSSDETTTGEQPSANQTKKKDSPSPSETNTSGGGGNVPKGDGTLTVGALLPQTGDLAFLGPPEFAGIDLAVKDINAAGGVLGKPVKQERADSGDGTPNIAPSEANKLLNADADVIVGAASSSVSLSVIDKITGAGVVQISPANTSTAFDTYDDKGLYFRTAPSDVLQGAVLANLVADDGFDNVAIMARQDSYGEALADQTEKVFTSGGGEVVSKVLYDANASTFSAEVSEIAGESPDAVVLIAFNETQKIIPEMIKNDIGPKDVQIYFVDGNTSNEYKFPPGTLEGIRATYPGAELQSDFQKRMKEVNPNLKDFTYGPESYDATMLAALAATAADNDSGEAIASQLGAVSSGGTECTEYSECVKMLEDGEDIDYQGVSGPIDFNETGSPSAATIGIFEYGKDNTYSNVKYVTGQI